LALGVRIHLVLSVGALVLCAVRGALAQSDTQVALAEALYQQGRLLVAEGKYDEACPKFAESHRLEPATGTLLNLAACHEAQGKTATAWIQFNEAFIASRRDRREDRMKFAQEHLAALEPKLSRLTLVVPAEADEPGLELWLDGSLVGLAVRGVPTPVDPGRHVVEAKAPGKKGWQQTVEIGASADNRTVTLSKLEPLAAAAPAPLAPPRKVLAWPRPLVPPRDEVERPVPTSVYIAGGATLALGAAAGITGAVYLDQKASYDRTRRDNPTAASADHDSVEAIGIVNLGLWIATAGGAALTGYFYFTRPERPSTTARFLPWATHESAGLMTAGEF
jgi:hypothetical protein